MSDEWLKSLKVGDRVIAYENSFYHDIIRITRVEKVTPTGQIKIVGEDAKFKDGRMIGRRSFQLRECTPEAEQAALNTIKRRKAVSFLSHVQWREQPDNKLFAVYDIINTKGGEQ